MRAIRRPAKTWTKFHLGEADVTCMRGQKNLATIPINHQSRRYDSGKTPVSGRHPRWVDPPGPMHLVISRRFKSPAEPKLLLEQTVWVPPSSRTPVSQRSLWLWHCKSASRVPPVCPDAEEPVLDRVQRGESTSNTSAAWCLSDPETETIIHLRSTSFSGCIDL